MPPADKISLKTFWENVEQRLAACTADELRAILRSMAQETLPSGRQAFLARLGPVAARAAGIEQEIKAEDLLNDIADLAAELEEAIAEAPEPEEHYEWGEYDDEAEDAPYAEFTEPLVALFDRAQAAFDYGEMQLAREAYAALFDVLDQQDEYGRGVSPSELTGVDIGEAWARYLRAAYETMPVEGRPAALLDEMRQVRSWVAGARPKLDDLIQISPAPLPGRDRFMADWITFLRGQPDGNADALLREAVRLAQGTAGLAALARSEGRERPRAYLDWFTALAQEGKHREVVVEAQAALALLPADKPIHAALADHLCAAAQKLNEPTIVRAGRWEAFTAKPTLVRLLDLWEVTTPGADRTALMQRALQRLQEHLAQPLSQAAVAWEGDDLEQPTLPSKAAVAHACLLAGDLEAAHAQAAREKELGWSSGENTQGLVVPFFLGLFSGRSFAALPPNLARLWQTGLQTTVGFMVAAGEPVHQRLQRIYAAWPVETPLNRKKQEILLAWCLDVARQRVENIVSNQRRGSYGKAALLTVAVTEALRLGGDAGRGNAFLEAIRTRFPRHSAFQAELRSAVALMEHSKPA